MYLNTHSRFSLRYGVLSVDDMLSWAQAAGVTRMALTDVGTTSANWDFVRRAERFGVAPALGIDVRNGNARRFVALARHAAGYEALCRWYSELNLAGTPFPARLPEAVRAAGVAAQARDGARARAPCARLCGGSLLHDAWGALLG